MWPDLDAGWSVVGTGDFNGDGITDILIRNADGAVSDWLGKADGSSSDNTTNAFNAVGTDWHVSGIGDFNGDGRSDILWRNDSGTIADWLGTTLAVSPAMEPIRATMSTMFGKLLALEISTAMAVPTFYG